MRKRFSVLHELAHGGTAGARAHGFLPASIYGLCPDLEGGRASRVTRPEGCDTGPQHGTLPVAPAPGFRDPGA